ncbi:MAG: hypothetical protein WDN06_11105 [Asticcacaulis sp.]
MTIPTDPREKQYQGMKDGFSGTSAETRELEWDRDYQYGVEEGRRQRAEQDNALKHRTKLCKAPPTGGAFFFQLPSGRN